MLLLVQGDQAGWRIDNGERSVLVGLQSFAEGLDLKGDYLTQVHIHKIAFPPIDSPVDHRRRMAEKPEPLSV
ncbi:helicase C-terminal domain protein [Enterobacter hormaechei subsp. xiangfangensis]|nr:helicase C-terminal domain protein [Enterobacter hormaechei subsp. xiangfangensis]